MGVSVLILGVSGTGKSSSMRNFDSKDIAWVNVAGKPLPFKGTFEEKISTDSYEDAKRFIERTKKQSIVVDDAQYLMGNEFMRRATEKGYDKFTEMAQNFWKLLRVIQDLPEEKIVYLLGHIELDANGTEKFKTMGKMLDQKINVEGLCTIVLKTSVADGQFSFVTQNNGHDTVKSPFGMFPTYAIDNDLKYVDEKIRNYYELGEFVSDAEIEEADKQAAKPEIQKPEAGAKRRRGKTEESETTEEKPKRRSRKEESVKEPESAEDSAEPPKRKRRSREEVQQENDERIANAGIEESGDNDEVPYDEVDDPKPEKLPRKRKSRTSESESEQEETEHDSVKESDKVEQDSESGSRRRRRRSE